MAKNMNGRQLVAQKKGGGATMIKQRMGSTYVV